MTNIDIVRFQRASDKLLDVDEATQLLHDERVTSITVYRLSDNQVETIETEAPAEQVEHIPNTTSVGINGILLRCPIGDEMTQETAEWVIQYIDELRGGDMHKNMRLACLNPGIGEYAKLVARLSEPSVVYAVVDDRSGLDIQNVADAEKEGVLRVIEGDPIHVATELDPQDLDGVIVGPGDNATEIAEAWKKHSSSEPLIVQ